MARRTKLTPEIQGQICAKVAQGTYPEIAAEICGVTDRTYYRWMSRGRKAKSGAFRQFCQAIKKAAAEWEDQKLARIDQAGAGGQVIERRTIERVKRDGTKETETVEKFSAGQWTADAWIMERRAAERWALKEQQALVKLTEEVKELKRRVKTQGASAGNARHSRHHGRAGRNGSMAG